MNFKNAYKSMTDEIHGDRALLHQILNGETRKRSKRFGFIFKPAYTAALAAVFVVCMTTLYFHTGIDHYVPSEGSGSYSEDTVNNPSDFTPSSQLPKAGHTPDDSQIPENGMLSEDEKSKSENTALTAETAKSEAEQEDKTHNQVPAEKNDDITYDENTDRAKKDSKTMKPTDNDHAPAVTSITSDETSAVAESEDVLYEKSGRSSLPSEASADMEHPKHSADDSASVSDSPGAYSGGGGGGSSAGSSSYDAQKTISIAQYWSYLGKNIQMCAVLPAEVSLFVPATVTMNTGGTDVLVMMASSADGSKNCTIAVSKKTPLQSILPGALQFKSGAVNIAVECYGFDSDEESALVASLK